MNYLAEEIKSIYIHIPFCLSKCKYCDFFSIPCENHDNPVSDDYISSILNELEYKIEKFKINSIRTIYIGGGTPSLLNKNQLSKIFSFLKSKLIFEDNYEFTMEVNPDDITEDLVQFLQDSPVNRISCGIQSMDQNVLERVNRRAGVKENENALSIFQKYWKKTLSLDLICGLPNENSENFIDNFALIFKYKPHHISMYSLTIEDETPLGRELENNVFEYDYDYADEMWLKTKELLKKNDYNQYEISNFCKKGFECNHNLTYWNHENYLGIGAGAAESIYKKDGSAVRNVNKENINEYINFWNYEYKCDSNFYDNIERIVQTEAVDIETSKFEFFMMGLRKASGISDKQYFNCFDEKISEKVIKLFYKWMNNGLAVIINQKDETIFKLNEKGLLFLNKFLEELEI